MFHIGSLCNITVRGANGERGIEVVTRTPMFRHNTNPSSVHSGLSS